MGTRTGSGNGTGTRTGATNIADPIIQKCQMVGGSLYGNFAHQCTNITRYAQIFCIYVVGSLFMHSRVISYILRISSTVFWRVHIFYAIVLL